MTGSAKTYSDCPTFPPDLAAPLFPQPGEVAEESIDVGRFLDDLRRRLARSVSGAGFDADQVRLGAGLLRRLQCRDIFEAVARDDAVVGVGGRHQHRRIVPPAL